VPEPGDHWMVGPYERFYECFPELQKYKDKIHLVYASTHASYAFNHRDTQNVIDEVRRARSQGKKKIVFFNGSETFMPSVFFKAQRIAELLTEIPKEDLFYCVGVPAAQEFYDNVCKERGWSNRMNMLGCHHFESVILKHAKEWEHVLNNMEYDVRPKDKLFVCFNKVHRRHRIQLLAEAIRNGWLEKSFYSFEGGYPNWYLDNKPGQWTCSKDDLRAILSIQDKLPLRLNITPKRVNPVEIHEDDIQYHEHSYFSIVTETIFEKYDSTKQPFLMYMDTLFLSEKIYKPLALKHPFIVFGWHGSLRELKKRGYKTFHPFIDESYDEEKDDDTRFSMLVEEIQRLEQFTIDQWLEWQNNIKPIVEHNYKYLMSLTEHRDGPPVDHLFIN